MLVFNIIILIVTIGKSILVFLMIVEIYNNKMNIIKKTFTILWPKKYQTRLIQVITLNTIDTI